jgi:hypothetical protein
MRQIIIYALLILLLYSCKEKTSYQLRVLIKNETKSELKISLFPKAKYLSGNSYDFSEISGGYRNATFEIMAGLEEEIYIAKNINMKPTDLTEQVFDSIKISTLVGNKNELKFTPDTVTGYSINLYKNILNWDFEISDFDLQTSFKRNPVESHDYTFVISEDKYLKK